MDNKPEKKTVQTEQEILLELQMRAAGKARIPDLLSVITCALIILTLSVAMFVIPDKTFSEQENRELQQFPAISDKKFLDNLLNGSFTADIAKYYSDQFPLRDTFVGLKGIAEIALLKGENDGVILAENNYLITKDSYRTVDQLMTNIERISEFAGVLSDIGGIPVTLAAAGRSIDALSIYVPASYPMAQSENLWTAFDGLSKYSRNINGVNLLQPLKQLIDSEDKGQIYYRTDHHWTTLGAYYAYAEIIKSFKDGTNPRPLSDFTAETASDSFYGTTWSKAGMKWIEADSLYYFRYDGDENFITTIQDTGKTFNGFYDLEYLDKKDKYGSFISGNNARVDITASEPSEPRPKMLLIKDSFAHSVVPFLAYHYDLVILDLRYYTTESVAKVVYEEGIDRVLFLYNIDNLSQDDTFGILQYGVKSVLESYKIAKYPIRNIYINDNNILDGYVIVCPTEANDTKNYYIGAAQKLNEILLARAGIELEIVRTDDFSGLDKIIAFTDKGLPAAGLIKIATEGSNLMFRCDMRGDAPGYAAGIFIDKYLKRATGSFNFGENFIYSDITESFIVIQPY